MDNKQVEYYNQRSKDIKVLITPFKDNMTHEEWLHISELIDVNEFGVAFEGFCGFLTEKQFTLSSDQKRQIETLGVTMKIDEKFWKNLV